MKIKGICKDCRWRWRYGMKGKPQHLFCIKDSRIIKNPQMKSCPKYEQADAVTLKHFKKCGLGSAKRVRKNHNTLVRRKNGLEGVKTNENH